MKQRGEVGCRLRLQETGFGKGVRCALADDEVIYHPDIDHGQGGFQPFRERAIGGRGLGHSRWMLVRQDQCRGVEVQGAPNDRTRIDGDVINRADAKPL